MKCGDFPRPVSLGSKCVRWRVADFKEWEASRPPCPDLVEMRRWPGYGGPGRIAHAEARRAPSTSTLQQISRRTATNQPTPLPSPAPASSYHLPRDQRHRHNEVDCRHVLADGKLHPSSAVPGQPAVLPDPAVAGLPLAGSTPTSAAATTVLTSSSVTDCVDGEVRAAAVGVVC